MKKVALCALLAVVCLSGCSVMPGFVGQGWSTNMRELGIHPVFPPREDLRVGDVFVIDRTAENTAIGGWDSLGVLYDGLPLTSQLTAFYQRRPAFPGHKEGGPSTGEFQPNESKSILLRGVAFPGFVKVVATGADISTMLPVGGSLLGVGGSLRNAEKATLTMGGGESYALPLSTILAHVGDERTYLEKIAKQLNLISDSTPRKVDVVIVNEVFFARTFNVAIELKSNAKADVATPGYGQGNSAPATSSTEGDEAAAKKTLEQLQTELETAMRANLAPGNLPVGAKVSAGRNALGNITLNTTYPAPMAIGYRGWVRRLEVIGTDASGKPVIVWSTPKDNAQALSGTLQAPQ